MYMYMYIERNERGRGTRKEKPWCVHGGQGKTEESEQGKAGHGVAMQDREGHQQQGGRKKGINKEGERRWRLG